MECVNSSCCLCSPMTENIEPDQKCGKVLNRDQIKWGSARNEKKKHSRTTSMQRPSEMKTSSGSSTSKCKKHHTFCIYNDRVHTEFCFSWAPVSARLQESRLKHTAAAGYKSFNTVVGYLKYLTRMNSHLHWTHLITHCQSW